MNKVLFWVKASLICLLAFVIGVTGFGVEAGATETEGTNPAAAVIVIDNYSIEGGSLEAGKDISINLTLHNVSKTVAATSILMTVSSASGLIYPSYGNDNQFFVGTIAAGVSESVIVPVTIAPNYDSETLDLVCKFDYASMNTKMTNTATIVIPNSGGGSIEVKSTSVSSHATVNGESLLSISFANLTSEKITDAEILVNGNVSPDSRVISLGTIKANKNYSEDLRIKFTEAGDQEIELVFAYTDVDGQRVETDLGKYSVEVEENQVITISNENEEMILWIGRGISALGLILAAVVIILYIKKR